MLQVSVSCKLFEIFSCLLSELSCWSKHDPSCSHYLWMTLQLLDHWNQECCSLTRPGSRHCNNIVTFHRSWNCFSLNWRWHFVALCHYCFEKELTHIEALESAWLLLFLVHYRLKSCLRVVKFEVLVCNAHLILLSIIKMVWIAKR